MLVERSMRLMTIQQSCDTQLLVSYDDYGAFGLGAAIDISGMVLTPIAGGLFDGGCGANDFCYDTFNQYCVNTNACVHDVACAKNGVC